MLACRHGPSAGVEAAGDIAGKTSGCAQCRSDESFIRETGSARGGHVAEVLGDDLSLYELKPVRERNSVAHRKLLLCSLRHAGGRRTRSYDSGRGC